MSLILSGSNGLSDVDGSASTPAIRGTDANTGIFFPAADTIAFAEGGTESMRLDSSGNVGIGTSSPSYRLDVVGAGNPANGIVTIASNATNSTTKYGYYAIRHYTNAQSPVTLVQGESNSTDSWTNVGGGNGETNACTQIRFFTAANNTTVTGTERMRIDSSGNLLLNTTTLDGGFTCNKTASFAGNIYPTVDNNGWNCGTAAKRWSTIFAVTGTINTSDANQKQDIASLDETEKRVAVAIKSLIKKYRFKDAVVKKGDEARIHVGVIAQEVQAAFVAEGLDANRYALFCSDTWVDEETNEQKTRLGVRYDELLAFVIAAI